MLAVVVADVEIDGDFHFDRQKVGTMPADLRCLANWLVEQDVEEVVMESTAQYRRPVWKRWNSIGAPTPCARWCATARGHPSSRPSAIESRTRGPQEGLPGCGAIGETHCRAGADPELRARHGDPAPARVRYEERGPAVSVEAKKVRARKMIRELRSLGYRVELLQAPSGTPA